MADKEKKYFREEVKEKMFRKLKKIYV